MEVETTIEINVCLQTAKFDFGITAEKKYFSVETIYFHNFQRNQLSDFFINFDFFQKTCTTTSTFFNNETRAMFFEFKFDNITLVNFWGKSIMILYKYPPRERVADKYEIGITPKLRDLSPDFPWANLKLKKMHNLMRNCSAFYFENDGDLTNLRAMLEKCDVTVTTHEYIYERFPTIDFNDENRDDYYFQMVDCLGYPGKFLLHRYNCYQMTTVNSSQLLTNMWYHTQNDRTLQSCVVPEGNFIFDQQNHNWTIKKIIITPTRRILLPPMPTSFCPIFRFVDCEKIIEIAFRNDDGNMIFDNYHFSQLAESICLNGIAVCGQVYYELGCSNSKFRERGSLFYQETKENILEILKSFGNFERALPAKIASRIGLNFTTVMPGIEVHYHDVKDDIVSDDNKYNFTDGCGQMSFEFALKLKEHLYLNYLPSAIQFRFPGFKGVLVLDQTLFRYQVVFRKSQQKYFPNLNVINFLDVIKVSRPAGCRMNKTYIEIWCQNAAKHGQEIENRVKNRIEQYYEDTLQSLIEKLLDPTKFGEALELLPKYMEYSKMKSFTPETFQSEPFFRQLVQSNVIMELKFVAEKQQINIPKNFGRTAIGVADFTRSLKEGEVYFCYSESLNSKCKAKFIVRGPIAIIRSPSLSLGDLQFVTAVDYPELHHLENVLVFSTYGDRPIQDKLSGGDLDGDEYVIIWDPELILPFSQPAAEFVQPKPEKSKIIEIDELQGKFPEFRKEYMRNDNVGYISNNLAILGELLGYDNKGVVKLAEKVDQAVLYFKSGIPSPGLENHEKSSFDPAHMKKDQKPMYCLENVIGRFHSKSQSIVEDIKQIQEFDKSLPKIDELVHLDGWEKYEEAAMIFFDAFKLQVNELLVQYGIQSTGELFSNQVFSLSLRGFETEKESVTSPLGCLQQKVFTLMKNLRTEILNQFIQNWEQLRLMQGAEFFDFYLPKIPEELKKFAVACYKVAYKNGDYLAFPWSLWDVIDDIRSTNQRNFFQQSMNSTVVDGFYANDSNDLTRWINNFQMHYNIEVNFKYYFNRFLNINRMTITDDWQKFTKFLWHYGTKEYDDFRKNPELKRFVKACRWLLFKLAFENSPKVFTIPHRMDETSTILKIARFAFELESLLNSATLPTRLAEQLLRLTNCAQIIISQPIDRNSSIIFQVLALGTKDAIEDLRNLLTIEINKSNVFNVEESHQIKVQSSSTKIMQILYGMNP